MVFQMTLTAVKSIEQLVITQQVNNGQSKLKVMFVGFGAINAIY